ncbi:MAG: hypothetical protein R2747_00880 [Pyrinomonadaceae bacterium]
MSAESVNVEKIKEDKPFAYIVQNLEMMFGEPQLDPPSDILDMLVRIILSQATTGTNSRRTFQNLKKRFNNWEETLNAEEDEIADAIRLGGLADQKSKVIKDLLRQIKRDRGKLSLEFLREMPVEDARRTLENFRGIGPKTAACTLLFAAHREIFPLDTHIFRIFKRMGILPQKISDSGAHRLLDQLVPPGKFYSLHVNLIRLGKQICNPRQPICEECPLVEYCDFGLSRI